MKIIDKSIKECINQLKNEITEKESQIQLLQNLDLTETVDENKWHDLCQTPLRTSDVLAQLVSNIFPNAEEIQVHYNYVYFVLYGFKIQIPTSLCHGINLDTGWFREYAKPDKILTQDEIRMKKYFECIDSDAGWYDCARYRLGTHWKKWYLFVVWWTKYKWKDAHREEWNTRFNKREEAYQERLKLFYDNEKQMNEKIILFVENVLPEINGFSIKHYNYNGNYSGGVDKVIEVYKLINEKFVLMGKCENSRGYVTEFVNILPVIDEN